MIKKCDDCKKLFEESQMRRFGLAAQWLVCKSCYEIRNKSSNKFLFFIIFFIILLIVIYNLFVKFYFGAK